MTLMAIPNSWGWFRNTETNTTDTPSPNAQLTTLPWGGNGTTKGAWTNISTYGSDTTIDADVLFSRIHWHATATSGSATPTLMDIGIDTAGGTSYQLAISNVLVGGHGNRVDRPTFWLDLPLRIPSGSSVAGRCAAGGSGGVPGVNCSFYGAPSRPESVWAGSFCESVGIANDGSVPTGRLGTAFTPGNSGSWGSWTSLGTTVRNLYYWSLFPQCDNATMSALAYFFQLAYGDGTTFVPIIHRMTVGTTAGEQSHWMNGDRNSHCAVPLGSTIYVRGVCSGTADTGWNAMALGVG